mgnify:CR=1 FL=1
MKVDAKLVVELRREVGLQIERVRRMIEKDGARDTWLLSLYRLKTLKRLLTGLLNDGELVLDGCNDNREERETRDEKIGLLRKLARFFRMENPEEFDD